LAAARDIEKIGAEAAKNAGLKPGTNGQFRVIVQGETITVRMRNVNGVFELGTAFKPK
jgi:predicted Rdx family selenoprotein